MRDVLALTAVEILGISLDNPEQLFTGIYEIADEEHKQLARKWHPRTMTDDSNVAAHINALYDVAIKKLDAGQWGGRGLFQFIDKDNGKQFQFRYLKCHDIELGKLYIGNELIAIRLNEEFEDLWNVARKAMRFQYSSKQMESDMVKMLPLLKGSHRLTVVDDSSCVLMIAKDPGAILMKDVITHFNGQVPAKHAAWMISRMLGINCYLAAAGISHNDISPETCFVVPKDHRVQLLGGWAYSVKVGETLNAMPLRAFHHLPSDFISNDKGDLKINSELIRATARELFGDITGSNLHLNKDIPQPLLQWLLGAGSDDPFAEFDTWKKSVLVKSFGPRKWVDLNLTPAEVYK